MIITKAIPGPARSFESYVPKSNTTMPAGPIGVNKLRNVVFSIKTNKCPGIDEINFGELCEPCLSKRIHFRTT